MSSSICADEFLVKYIDDFFFLEKLRKLFILYYDKWIKRLKQNPISCESKRSESLLVRAFFLLKLSLQKKHYFNRSFSILKSLLITLFLFLAMDIEQNQADFIDHFVKQASSAKGSALASVVVEATSHPSLFAFSEILAVPNVVEVPTHPNALEFLLSTFFPKFLFCFDALRMVGLGKRVFFNRFHGLWWENHIFLIFLWFLVTVEIICVWHVLLGSF